jgi:hypothetical protein
LSLSDNQHCDPATIKKKRRQTKSLRSQRITPIITSLPAAASHSERRYVLIQIVALQPAGHRLGDPLAKRLDDQEHRHEADGSSPATGEAADWTIDSLKQII